MQLKTVKVEKPADTNFVFGQAHFIKSVEDFHEALVGAVPGIKFGLAFYAVLAEHATSRREAPALDEQGRRRGSPEP
jgi:adenosine/AMP kinase